MHVRIFLLSLYLFLCRFDEPAKLFPIGFIKIVFIHFEFYLMPATNYFCRD